MIDNELESSLLEEFPDSRRDGIDVEDSIRALAHVIIVCTNEITKSLDSFHRAYGRANRTNS